jgi:nitrogen regulatory protein PII
MVDLVLPDDMADDTIRTIMETARTGEIGDGYNIRTGERDVT